MKTSLLFISALLLVVAFGPERHLRMTDSSPKKDAVLDAAPAEIRAWFNQDVHMNVSKLALHRIEKHGQMDHPVAIDLPAVTKGSDTKSFFVAVHDSLGLGAGTYRVTWETAGDDEHVVSGTFGFVIKTK